MTDSILDSTKKVLGIDVDYKAFDPDILMHINTTFSILSQLGIGPPLGFMIVDSTATWNEFLGEDLNLNSVKTYIYQKVRLMFDPPATSYAISLMQDQIKELEWRLNVHREVTHFVDPDPTLPSPNVMGDPIVIDGGVG